MRARVAVIGGGYGGIAVAKALDETADVTLVEPRDAFVHNVAALRGLVDPDWTDRLFLPYDRLLRDGRVLRDRAVRVDSGSVTVGSGERLDPDFVVVATGSTYPFPAKFDTVDAELAAGRLHATRAAIVDASGVLLLGAGPVGLELAGEIHAAWPGKRVTIVDPHDDILSGAYSDEFRAELRDQLDALGVDLVLGTSVVDEPPSYPGESKTFTVRTTSGAEFTADVWFRCYGVAPVSDFLAGDLAAARRSSGHVEVDARLRLPGWENVFAIGDVTAIAETKTAKAAGLHADVAAANIAALIRGGGEPRTYEPAPPGISLPLGPRGGASYSPERGMLDAALTSQLKGSHLRLEAYAALLGVA